MALSIPILRSGDFSQQTDKPRRSLVQSVLAPPCVSEEKALLAPLIYILLRQRQQHQPGPPGALGNRDIRGSCRNAVGQANGEMHPGLLRQNLDKVGRLDREELIQPPPPTRELRAELA